MVRTCLQRRTSTERNFASSRRTTHVLIYWHLHLNFGFIDFIGDEKQGEIAPQFGQSWCHVTSAIKLRFS
jgi:hypothetical protein